MEVIDISDKEYKNIFSTPYHVYNSVPFNLLNSKKCDYVRFLLFKDAKPRLGLILGASGDTVSSPFSAPFGGFTFLSDQLNQQHIDDALVLLDDYLKSQSIHYIKMILPPLCYNNLFLSKLINSLNRYGYSTSSVELNYVFLTSLFDQDYEKTLLHNARKKLQTSFLYPLVFKKTSDLKAAYEVIAINRKERGFPLRMTFEQVEKTAEIIRCDAFVVEFEQTLIASAIVFRVAQDIAQVIYWGDLQDYTYIRTMNFLSYKVFEYYKNKKLRIVDIGPSTENGIPNLGLCEFKESIGCNIDLKFVFEKKINA